MIIAGVAVAFLLSEVVRNVGGVLNHNTLDGETHVIRNAYVCVCVGLVYFAWKMIVLPHKCAFRGILRS